MTHRLPTWRTLFAALAALALVATSCGGGSTDSETAGESTSSAPASEQDAPADDAAAPAPAENAVEPAQEEAPAEASLVANTVSGGQIDFGSLEGQDVVLWFWAPW